MRWFWDHAWSYPSVLEFQRYQADDASYTGAARAERSYYDALRAAGIDIMMIQETTSERSQQGYNAGLYDVDFARRRSREVGHPDSAPIAYAVSDGSRDNPTWNGNLIADYGEAVAQREPGPFVFYGNRYAVDAACSGAARVPGNRCMNLNGGWIPRTWNFDPNRDTAAQEIGGAPVAGTDVNSVYRPIFDAQPGPVPVPISTGRPEMFVGLKERPGGTANDFDAAWVDGGVVIRWFGGDMGAIGYLSVPQSAIDFVKREPLCRLEVVRDSEWEPIERRTKVTQGLPVA
jgi:hypothetical protein